MRDEPLLFASYACEEGESEGDRRLYYLPSLLRQRRRRRPPDPGIEWARRDAAKSAIPISRIDSYRKKQRLRASGRPHARFLWYRSNPTFREEHYVIWGMQESRQGRMITQYPRS